MAGLSGRVLASPVYRRLWVSGVAYYCTFWVEIITTGWVILAITDSPFQVGLGGFFRMLPMLLLGSALGVLADRMRRIDILIGVHAVDLVAALVLACAFSLGVESVWLIYPMVAVIGCGWAADFSARRTLIDEIQERSLLANSMSLEALSMSGSKIIATLVAGFLLAVGDASLGYWFLSALYAFGLIWLLKLRQQLPARKRRPADGIRLVTAMRSGWSVMMRLPVVRGVFVITVLINVLVFPYQQLIAIIASDILSVGPFWMGLLASADGAGAIVTGIWLAFGRGPNRQGAFFAGGSVATAALLITLALSPVYALSLLIQFALGVCVGLFGAYQAALVLGATPPESRASALGLTPFGMLFVGGLSSAAGAQTAIAASGALGTLGLLVVFSINGSLRGARVAG